MKYEVSVDITISKYIEVDAENEDAAREAASAEIIDNAYYHMNYGTRLFVGYEIVDVDKQE